jgi:hypothetical protein
VADDKLLRELTFIPSDVAARLAEVGIRTARQLFHRLQSDSTEMRRYLQMPEAGFEQMSSSLRQIVADQFPADLLPAVTPNVSKKGVAVDRLGEVSRPRYYGDSDVYVSARRKGRT